MQVQQQPDCRLLLEVRSKRFAPNNFDMVFINHMCDFINRPNVVLNKMMCIQVLLFWPSLIICNFVSWCLFINRSIPVWSIRECWMEPEIDACFDLFITHSCCGSSCCKLTHTVTVTSILNIERNLHSFTRFHSTLLFDWFQCFIPLIYPLTLSLPRGLPSTSEIVWCSTE